MSMFPIPTEPIPGMKEMEANLERFTRDISAMIPKEFSGPANLMAHPLAAGAAMTALGAGMASQAIGIWIGSVAATMDAAQKMAGLGMPLLDPAERDVPSFLAPKSAAIRAKAAMETFAADVEEAARDAVEVSVEAAKDIVADVEAALETVVPPVPRASAEATDEAPEPSAAVDPAVASTAAALPLVPAKPAGIGRPETVDDLKAISGVGPKLEKVLNDLGIWTWDQIAAFGDAEIAWLDEHLGFRGRIVRDDWIGQARKLARGG